MHAFRRYDFRRDSFAVRQDDYDDDHGVTGWVSRPTHTSFHRCGYSVFYFYDPTRRVSVVQVRRRARESKT